MIPVSNVANSQSFSTWVTKTNQIASILSQNVVTVDNSAGGSLSSGNGIVNGWFSVANLTVSGNLLGGNNTAQANLNIGSNVVFNTGLTPLVSVLANATSSNLNLLINSITFGSTSVIVSAVNVGNNLTVLGNVLANQHVAGANVVLNTLGLFIGNSTTNNSINSTSYSGVANNSLRLGGNLPAFYANVTNPNFSANLTVGANVYINTSGIFIGNSTVNVSTNSSVFTGISFLANNATNLGGTPASGYQTTAGLASNVAVLSANFATFSGTANNSNNLNGQPASFYATAGSPTFSGTVNVGANVSLNTSALSIGNSTVNVEINSTAIFAQPSLSIQFQGGSINTIGNVGLNGTLFANGLQGLDGMVLTTSGDGSNAFWMGIQGNGTVGGTNGTIQFANNGAFDGDANLTYAVTSHTLFIGNTVFSPFLTAINSISFNLGNSTVNSVINASGITTTNDLVVSGNVGFSGTFPQGGRRNKVINGQFKVDQYSTFAPLATAYFANTTTINYYPIDRWFFNCIATGGGVFANGSPVAAPEQFSNALGFTTTTIINATSYAGANSQLPQFTVGHKIEQYKLAGLNLGYANSKPMTLSFWVWVSNSNTYGGAIQANGFSMPFRYTGTQSTWVKNIISIPPLTTGGGTSLVSNNSGLGMSIIFEHASALRANNVFLATNAQVGVWSANIFTSPALGVRSLGGAIGSWVITGVQLEEGPYASPYEYVDETKEIQDCKRYFHSGSSLGTTFLVWANYSTVSGQLVQNPVQLPVQMRASPAITFTNTFQTGVNLASQAVSQISNLGFSFAFNTNVAASAYQMGLTFTANSEL